MTNREMFLLATSILFASTTIGLALQGTLHKGPRHDRPAYHHAWKKGGEHKRPDMFTRFDTNRDGFVTRDEMLALQNERLAELFATVDTNQDGKLTRDEMEQGRKLMHAKMKARFEAERQAPAQPAPAPAN